MDDNVYNFMCTWGKEVCTNLRKSVYGVLSIYDPLSVHVYALHNFTQILILLSLNLIKV